MHGDRQGWAMLDPTTWLGLRESDPVQPCIVNAAIRKGATGKTRRRERSGSNPIRGNPVLE